MEWQEPQPQQTIYTEYIPEDILREAGIDGEPLAMEQLRAELYELEHDVAVSKNELERMKREWDGIKRSLRFTLIMLVVFFLLRIFMEVWYREVWVLSQWSAAQGDDMLSTSIQMGGFWIRFFRELFYGFEGVFLARLVYVFYRFFSNQDWKASRWWCNWQKKKNLCAEIEQYELWFAGQEDRLRRLKQVRTAYRERKQEEWREESLPERVAEERELG
ncbi:MAG: hypothetical protein NC254_04710 [bacterium]|nr:hypothetical protein [Clostridium sp.]MCM1537682.1 hypothetical protein [bacterium]